MGRWEEAVSAAEKQLAIEQVCGSQTFARCDRLRNLLQFICKAAIEGREADLKEYVIGVEALGRGESFSPTEDSCVRSRVYELRQRLERFYTSEAPDAAVRIEIPKGSYVPKFARLPEPPVAEVEPADQPALNPAPDILPAAAPWLISIANRGRLQIALAFVVGCALTYAAVGLGGRSSQPDSVSGSDSDLTGSSSIESVWRPLLDTRTPVLVSYQTRLFLQMGPLVVRDTTLDSPMSVESSQPVMRAKALFDVPQLYENRNYTDFAAVNASLLLSKVLNNYDVKVWAKRSVEVKWDDLLDNNLIVLGKPFADPDIARLLPKDYFVHVEGGQAIQNVQPMPGEPPEWRDTGLAWDFSQNWSEKYAIVTLIPGPRPDRWILSLGGSGAEHQWAMAQFLANPESCRQLLAKLQTPAGEMPPSWQVVVRADFKSQTPVRVSYVTHRTLGLRTASVRRPLEDP